MKWTGIIGARVRHFLVVLLSPIGLVPAGHLRCPTCGHTAESSLFEREERSFFNSPKVICSIYCPKCGRAVSRSDRSKQANFKFAAGSLTHEARVRSSPN
jgi:endogenous inhibitor of DNA gyrase (YacG/DUF329 family)